MKKNLFLTGILTTAFLFGCSDDVPDKGGVNGVTGDVGYVKVAINLPTVSGNSVKANDIFDDGIEAEYKVNDIILAIFEGTDENDADFKEAQNLSGLLAMQSGDNNVTVKYKSDVLEIGKPGDNKNVYALAIVNGSKLFSVDENKKLKFDGTDFSGKLSKLNAVAQNVDLSKIANLEEKNFLMMNAPITNKAAENPASGDRTVTTLVKLKVYDTKQEAEVNNRPDQIYVERAVAKVTTSIDKGETNNNTLTINAPAMTYDQATVKFEGWRLNLTNTRFYPVRNVSEWNTWNGYYVDTELNRFFGTVANPYRVYWAIDPNYETNAALNLFTPDNAPANWTDMAKNEYCAENTTNAAAMKRSNLTGVLLKARFKLAGTPDNANLFMLGNSAVIYNEEDFLKKAKAALTPDVDLKIKDGVEDGITITDAAGVKELICKKDNTELSDTEAADILATCSTKIKFYKDGVMFYYTSVIKHFGDNPTEFTGDVNNPEYDEAKHLGRYGVVRNNWYEINIKSVSGPGEPDIPVIPTDPVDKEKSFINAEINILSWAKRTQDVDL